MMMVGKPSWLLLVLCLWSGPGLCFESLKGPRFYNGSSVKVDVVISTITTPKMRLLKDFPSGKIFVMPERIEIGSMTIVSTLGTYELKQVEVAKQLGKLTPSEQLWVFDGARICVVRRRKIDPDAGITCP